MITKNISWSLGPTPNKSLAHTPQAVAEASIPSLLFRFTSRVTLAHIDHAKTAYVHLPPLAPLNFIPSTQFIASIESIASIPSISPRPHRPFVSLFITKAPSFRRKTIFFTYSPHFQLIILNS